MSLLAGIFGLYLVISTLWEGFETVVLPRTVTRSLRLTRLFYQKSWRLWSAIGRRMPSGSFKQLFLGIYGPLSLPILLGIWAILLVFGFALIQYGLGTRLSAPEQHPGFGTDLYSSGVTFFTLGYGDVVPRSGWARLVSVMNAGVGFGFLALIIGYLPVLYQAFSRREATISRLDSRASSPPSPTELLTRFSRGQSLDTLKEFLREWEQWASELLESHLSYPVLTYYRSQHEHQSWLGAMTTIMDTCALIIVGVDNTPDWMPQLTWQAKMTFAMARHAIVDLAYIFNAAPLAPVPDRLPPEKLAKMRSLLAGVDIPLRDGAEADEKLSELRGLYEPYVNALGRFLFFPLPPWVLDEPTTDNWQNSAWEHGTVHF